MTRLAPVLKADTRSHAISSCSPALAHQSPPLVLHHFSLPSLSSPCPLPQVRRRGRDQGAQEAGDKSARRARRIGSPTAGLALGQAREPQRQQLGQAGADGQHEGQEGHLAPGKDGSGRGPGRAASGCAARQRSQGATRRRAQSLPKVRPRFESSVLNLQPAAVDRAEPTYVSSNVCSSRALPLSWDDNGDGEVSRKEFHRAMPALGLDVPKKAIDDLFSECKCRVPCPI